jgi:hypothetical protein
MDKNDIDACDSCPYHRNFNYDDHGCIGEVNNDAIALLKEQEAVKPLFKQDEKGIFVWCCGSCGAYMYHIYDGIDKAKEYAKFCRQCGKPVMWEGR